MNIRYNVVKKKLEEYGYTILQSNELLDKKYLINCKNFIVELEESSGIVTLSFCCGSHPEDSANLILILQECSEVKKIVIAESYANINNILYTGDEAHKKFLDNEHLNFLNEWIKVQSEFGELMKDENCFKC